MAPSARARRAPQLLVLAVGCVAASALLLAARAEEPAAPPAAKAGAREAPPETHPQAAPQAAAQAAPGPNKALELEGIHNAFQWTDKLISGSCPVGEAGFKALADRGVKTIITVDGALPDVELARKFGMRYVHIPVEYSGIAQQDALKIARAVRDLPGPIFIHCHHGIHRGPAAAALAVIATARVSNEQALAGLTQAGTGANYKGLWQVVREFRAPTQAELDAVDATFPERAQVAALAGHMVSVDERFAGLKAVQAAGWQAPADHPDVDPAHEALLLREALAESARTDESKALPADFATRLAQAEAAAASLHEALQAGDKDKAQAAFDTVKASCGGCHALYRDTKAAQ